MTAVGLIPARLAAERLPDKPLLDICGKPMIQRVWERASQARKLDSVAVTTPDEEIARVVTGFGGQVVMTSASHRSGTERLAEAAKNLALEPDRIVVNIQGDEPVLAPGSIDLVVGLLEDDPQLPMASLMCPCPDYDLNNPACVKVVCDRQGMALYFSRARIPFQRRADAPVTVMQHVGLYAYRCAFLLQYAAMAPTPLEAAEGLEQLRVLENGCRIKLAEVDRAPVGVDTLEDLERARRMFAALPVG